MSSLAEDILFLSLTDTDSLETLVTIGLDSDAIPTEPMRPVVEWAIERFFESGRTRAPSRQALLDTWGTVIDDARVELMPEDEDFDTIEWAIEYLKSQYIHWQFQQWLKSSGTAMATAEVHERLPLVSAVTDELFDLVMKMQPRHMRVEITDGLQRALHDYQARVVEGHVTRGITFGTGMLELDQHTYGIHPGEVAVVAAGPKTGKSFMLDRVAKECWWTAKQDTVLFTLENSVKMTVDRIACIHLGIDSRRWQRGECLPEEVARVEEFIHETLPNHEAKLHVIMPEPGKRSMAAMVREAQMLDAQALFIDQLTFVEHPDPGRKGRPEIIRDLMHSLKTLVSTGNQPIPVMIAHQINRDGMASARKTGYLLMDHMAEGSEVERTADWVFGLYQSADDRIAGEALFQVLAARREDTNNWKLIWQPGGGNVAVIGETEIAA